MWKDAKRLSIYPAIYLWQKWRASTSGQGSLGKGIKQSSLSSLPGYGTLLIPKTCASTWPGSVWAAKSASSAQHSSIRACIYRRVLYFSTSPVPEIICLSAVSSLFCDFNHPLDLSYFKGRGKLLWFLEKWSHYLLIYEDWFQLSCFTTSVFLDMFSYHWCFIKCFVSDCPQITTTSGT